MVIDCFKAGVRSLIRNKVRTLLATSSIAIGVCAVVVISAIGEIGKEQIKKEFSSTGLSGITIGVNSKLFNIPLGSKQVDIVSSHPLVDKVAPAQINYTETSMRGYVSNSVVWGIKEDANEVVDMEVLYGRMLNKSDTNGITHNCVVDRNLAKSFYKRENVVGKELKLLINGTYHSFKVVGVVETGGQIMQGLMTGFVPSFVYIPYTTMSSITGTQDFDQIAVKLKNPELADNIGNSLVETLSTTSGYKNGYTMQNMAKQEDQIENTIGIVSVIISSIGGISLFVAGVGIMSIMLVTVRERTYEIGIKKAIGAKNSIILLEFLSETITIGLCGGVMGVLLSIGIIYAFAKILNTAFVFNLLAAFISIVASFLVCLVFGIYPAIKAAKLNPINALRHNT